MKKLSGDRTAHATYDGMVEIVRYDRAGKWYLEPTDPRLRRQKVTITQAVVNALWGVEHANGRLLLGRPGGSRFDYLVAQAQEEQT